MPGGLRRNTLIALLALPLAACGGGQKSTLPPAPTRSGAVSLHNLARYPEVYAGAQIATTGTVARPVNGSRHGLYTLRGGHGARIALEPPGRVRAFAGRRVRVRGFFTASFATGYELVVTHISRP